MIFGQPPNMKPLTPPSGLILRNTNLKKHSMRKNFTYVAILLSLATVNAQENYRDFEAVNKATLAEWNGVMDSTTLNTFTNAVNSSSICAKYIRDTATYDNFKLFPLNSLVNVASYADTAASAPRITLKVRTNAPPGTFVKVQLGSRTSAAYPTGVHSEYTATTTVSNAWELLTFKYWMSPVGGYTVASGIDKIVFFFHPGAHSHDTVYFDDPTGPQLIVIGVQEHEAMPPVKLYQNIPNPASASTVFKFNLSSAGNVEFTIKDMLGRNVGSLDPKWMETGMHEVPFDSSQLENGIYFYTIRMKGYTDTKRMVISR
jgi:hypothetical protein